MKTVTLSKEQAVRLTKRYNRMVYLKDAIQPEDFIKLIDRNAAKEIIEERSTIIAVGKKSMEILDTHVTIKEGDDS